MTTSRAIKDGAAEGLRLLLLAELSKFTWQQRGPQASTVLPASAGYGVSEIRKELNRMEADGLVRWRSARGAKHWHLSRLGRGRIDRELTKMGADPLTAEESAAHDAG